MSEKAAISRRDEIYPVFDGEAIERIASFGSRSEFRPGETVFRAGETGIGLVAVLTGRICVYQQAGTGPSFLIGEHGPGMLVGEINSLSGRPALVSARAEEAATLALLSPGQARALIIAEAMLGERVMRALILRRVRLIERGAGGPLIVAPAEHPGRIAIVGFLRRNGLPFTLLIRPTTLSARIWSKPSKRPISFPWSCFRMGRL